MKTNPLNAGHFTDFVHKLRQLEAIIQIDAIIGRVLSDQADLLDALLRKLLHLSHNRFHRAAAEVAPHNRNAAEGAIVIAALRNFDISGVARRRNFARQNLFIVEHRIANADRLPALERFGDDIVNFVEVPVPTMPSISGISSNNCSLYRCVRHPETMSAFKRAVSFKSASSKIVLTDSSFAASMNPQVLTIMTVASSACSTNSCPY